MDTPASSTRLFPRLGSYTLLREIGQGGSGVVYAAERDGEGIVALKVLREELALSSRERHRFLKQAERMGRVDHPGLIGVLDSGTSGSIPYIAMPLLEGEPLSTMLARGPLPADTAFEYFTILAGAVGALHESGLLHRDIKPENVFVDEGPVLLDLGIARDVNRDTTTETGVIRGTPAYMAPERFFGAPASVATDIYELAVLLYVMLTGLLPWGDGTRSESRLHPRDPTELGVAPAVAKVLLRALSTRREVRPPSAHEFVQDVVRARLHPNDFEATTTQVLVSSRRASSTASSERPRAAVLASIAVVAAAAMGLGTWRAVTSSPPAAREPRSALLLQARKDAAAAIAIDGRKVTSPALSRSSANKAMAPLSGIAPAVRRDVVVDGPPSTTPPDPPSTLYQDRK